MRSTKYDWICLMRYAQFGGYDPSTGDTKPVVTVRQEQWVRAFFRADGVGSQFQPYSLDGGTSGIEYYGEKNLGKLFIKDLPNWSPIEDPTTPGKFATPTQVYAFWPVIRPNFDANAPATRFNWVPILGVTNAKIGTRFSKHYQAQLAQLQPSDVLDGNIAREPDSSAPLTDTFEEVEQRLRIVLQVGQSIVNK